MEYNLRALEKTDKFGFIFYISYDGTKFHSFDEVSEKTSVKSSFIETITSLGFSWAKGVQQGGRTDSKVSANENLLYVSSHYKGNLELLRNRFNSKSQFLKIKKIVKTLPNLAFPEMVEAREYIYSYPQKKITNSQEKILELCSELSGTYDVSRFTDKKGLELKEHIRTVHVTYEDEILKFIGDSFMPKQVRIMSSFILTDSYQPLPGKYLTLEKIHLKKELEDMYINSNNSSQSILLLKEVEALKNLDLNAIKTESLGKDITILYIPKEIKSEFIGKNGNNIKKIKKILGDILVREV